MDLDDITEKWQSAYHEILDELYNEATPGLDYNGLDEAELVDENPPTYLRHYLDAERQEEIVEEVCDRYGIPEELYFNAKRAVFLSAGPSTSLENVDRARTSNGLEPVTPIVNRLEPEENKTHKTTEGDA